MANTQALKRRIKTAKNVSKTTKAMQMIAASKLKRAQMGVLSSRPYVNKLTEITKNLGESFDLNNKEITYFGNKLGVNKSLYLIIAPDKGLCGGLVSNLVREYLKIKRDDSFFITVGKKIETSIASLSKNLVASFPFGSVLPSFENVYPIKKIVDEYYFSGRVSSVKIVTTKFNSVFSQKVEVINLLPLSLDEVQKNPEHKNENIKIFEPAKEKLLLEAAKRYVEMVIFQNLLESFASEQASRMMAMQNATNNANDIASTLQLLYNKARQEKITNEILDITGAAVALSEQ